MDPQETHREDSKGKEKKKGRTTKPKPEKPPKQEKVKEGRAVTITKGEIIIYFDE